MSLSRSDVRLKLRPEFRAAAEALANTEGMSVTEFCEAIVLSVIRREVAKADVRHRALVDQGVLGTDRAHEVTRAPVPRLALTLRR